MQASNQAMLADVLPTGRRQDATPDGGVYLPRLRSYGSAVSAQLASSNRLGGLSIPNSWAQGATEMSRGGPGVYPATSVSPVTASANLPNSPFTQALMGCAQREKVWALPGCQGQLR